MADVFDIDSGSRMDYHNQHNEIDSYTHRGHGGWTSVDTSSRKDPRLANRRDVRVNTNIEQSSMQLYDKLGVPISPVRKHYSRSPSPKRRHRRSPEHSSLSPRRKSADRDGWHSPQRLQKQQQMYSQPPLPPQAYQQPPPPPVYQHEQYSTTGYPSSASSYQQGYGQVYGQPPTTTGYNQYSSPAGYPQQPQGYNSGHQQPGPPGDEYPGAWAPVTTSYPNMSQPPPPVARPSPAPPSSTLTDAKKDNLKKEAAIANEMKQQQATLIKQRDEYLRKASVLRRELDKLRLQKHELLTEKSPPRDSQRILRENAKLQLEIQNKLKSINNVVDMLSGIIGDGLQMKDDDGKTTSSTSPKRLKEHSSRTSSIEEDEQQKRSLENYDTDVSYFNYIHYDPELHWCRVCDVFPRSAKDFLNHLHSAEHRQVTQEHQLVDTPWHKLPTDEELPSYKGAPVKRIPIKGLQFFISATAWYCKLCDAWIGDLHCASLHLKSKNHSHNYSNFVEQNPHWETNWLKDREKAFERCGKLKLQSDEEGLPPAPEPPLINDKRKNKKRKEKHDSFLDISKEKKRKKKSKKRKKIESSGSSSSSSSSESSSEEDSDRSKSIRVAMRNKMRMQAQLILKEEMEGKLEALGRLVEEDRRKKETEDTQQESNIEDNIINQWMTVNNQTSTDKHILEGLKGRLKQRQEADKEKAEQAAAEQRKREREREERELKEMREREQKEMEEKVREEQEKEERDREERERIKEKERSRRRHRSDSTSPERYRGRSRSRSVDRRSGRSHNKLQERQYRRSDKRSDRHSPESDKYKPKRYEEERNVYESHFEKQTAELAKSNKEKKSASSSSSRKLPFIGRMPLFKKKGDGEEKEIKKEDYDIRQSKFEPVSSARAFIPAPGVVHITKLATPPDPMQMIKINAENPPPPPKIIPEPPQISKAEEVAPPPPIITPIITEPPVDSHELEIEDVQAPPLPPGVPVAEAKPLAKPAGNHLPRDFQEALNIIFPGDQRPDQMAMAQDPNLMMQYQYGMGYGMMYPGMQMYDYSAAQDPMAGSEEAIDALHAENRPEETHPGNNDDDLAMLGIDAEDMAAQTI